MSASADNLLVGEIEHVHCRLVDKFEGAIWTGEDDSDVKIADERAETLCAFAEGLGGAMLLGEIGERDENVGDFAGGAELGKDVDEGPNDFLGVELAPADYAVVDGLAGGNNGGNQAFGIGENGAVVAKRLKVEVDE